MRTRLSNGKYENVKCHPHFASELIFIFKWNFMKYLFDMYLDKIVDVILRIYTVCVCHEATWRECESGALNAFSVVETRVDGNIGWLNTENCRNTHRNGKAMICNRNKHCEVAWAARIPKSIKIQWQRSEFMFSIWLRQWMNEANVCVCVCCCSVCIEPFMSFWMCPSNNET